MEVFEVMKERIKTILDLLVEIDEQIKKEIELKLNKYIEYAEHIDINDMELYINLLIKTSEVLDEYNT